MKPFEGNGRFARIGLVLSFAAFWWGCGEGPDETGGRGDPLQSVVIEQRIGVYDRTFNYFTVSDCFGCHAPSCTDPAAPCAGVSDLHHYRMDPRNPNYQPNLVCGTCHETQMDAAGNAVFVVSLECGKCHVNSPHHTSSEASLRHCVDCHGSTVQNMDDGHYIPTAPKTATTPAVRCREWTSTTGNTCKAGGCEACHGAYASAIPPFESPVTLHHGTGLGVDPNPQTQCGWCHSIQIVNGVPTEFTDIRACETCHGMQTLHNVQYDYDTTRGSPGLGHVGSGDDCYGCHTAYATWQLPPSIGATVPTMYSLTPNRGRAGVPTDVVLRGQSFVNTIAYPTGAKTFQPTVVLTQRSPTGAVTTVAVAPRTATQDEIVATLPATVGDGLWEVRVYKDYGGPQQRQSNRHDLVLLPNVTVSSATLACRSGANTVTVSGTGFGPAPSPDATMVGVFSGSERCAAASWTDSAITAVCTTAAEGTAIRVIGSFNTTSPVTATLAGAGCSAVTTVSSATLACTNGANTVTVSGSGFGPQPSSSATTLGVFSGSERCAVASWTDTAIVAACTTAKPGSTISVVGSLNPTAPVTATLSGSACAPAAPAAKIGVTGGGASAACGPTPSCTSFTALARSAVTFDASASTAAAPATVRSQAWTVRRGTKRIASSTARVFTYSFASTGAHSVSLTVTDSNGVRSPAAVVAVTVR